MMWPMKAGLKKNVGRVKCCVWIAFIIPLGCEEDLGMASGAILDDQITASSTYNSGLSASKSRLHSNKAWAAHSKDEHQWLQIDLGVEYTTNVTKVATQGSSVHNEWVTKYKLQYSHNGTNFQFYRDSGQNTDKVETVINVHFFYMEVPGFFNNKPKSCKITDKLAESWSYFKE